MVSPRRLITVVRARGWPPALARTLSCSECGAVAKSPVEIGSRLRTGEVLRSRRCEAHTSRVRDPGRACVRRHRFDRDRIPLVTISGMPPNALGRAHARASALPKAPLEAFLVAWRLDHVST